jgi:Histone RNA hairpin-binding protein RNA-binding domain
MFAMSRSNCAKNFAYAYEPSRFAYVNGVFIDAFQTEKDDKELSKRAKHLASVKNTKQYQKYLKEVPKEQRIPGEHPMTPDHNRKYA